MTFGDLLRRLVRRLDEHAIPHMVTGSVASAFHGEPRSTADLDLVVDPTREALLAFARDLPEDEYYVDLDTARDAFERRSQFNVIDMASGWKVDLIVRKARPFSIEEFARRMPARLYDVDVFIATPEDAILSKLEWARDSASERQLRDVAGILAVSAANLDQMYLERWIDELGVRELWERVVAGR